MIFSSQSEGRAPRSLGAIAREILRRKRFLEKGRYGALESAWQELVGDELAARTCIEAFRNGQLEVAVDSPVLLQELDGFMKGQLLDALRATEAGRDVVGVRFRLGARPGGQERADRQEGPNGS